MTLYLVGMLVGAVLVLVGVWFERHHQAPRTVSSPPRDVLHLSPPTESMTPHPITLQLMDQSHTQIVAETYLHIPPHEAPSTWERAGVAYRRGRQMRTGVFHYYPVGS